MNIFDFALKMEKDSENLYLELGEKSKSQGIKKIFEMLANDEVKHQEIILQIKNNEEKLNFIDTEVLEYSTEIFQKIRENSEKIDLGKSETAIYEKARDFEKDSQKFYQQKSNEVLSERQKNIFLKLAQEEEKHFFIMDNLVTHVSRPERWVEHAMFGKREEY